MPDRILQYCSVPFVAAWLLLTGCQVPEGKVRVSPSPAPAPLVSLPTLNTARVEPRLVPAERPALSTESERRFAAAREAFWNRETEAAVDLLRGLSQEAPSKSDARHLQRLMVDCYQEDGRWEEARKLLVDSSQTAGQRKQKVFAEFMAGLPARSLVFGTNASPVTFELRRGQWVVARVRINGLEAIALIDTGFSMSLVTENFARRAGIELFAQTIELSDANDSGRQVRVALVQELELGGLLARKVPVVCSPAGFLDNFLGEVDAVIGWDLLQQADATWNFPEKVMAVSAPSGPRVEDPMLSGRRAPLLTVRSAQGRALELFLDTGYASMRPEVSLSDNAGLLFTKLDRGLVKFRWRPSFEVGMNSFRIRWPRSIRPFSFWFDGHSFEMPRAAVHRLVDVREGWQTCDGIVGNAPFLSGTLRLCGVRRLATFTPGRVESSRTAP